MMIRRRIDEHFEGYPIQKRIVSALLTYGLRISGEKIYCGPIEISNSKFARAIDVDRRAISSTITNLKRDRLLHRMFSHILPTIDLREVAPLLNWGVIEIVPEDPSLPGILAGVSTILAEEGISIRQAIGNDYELTKDPRLYIITEKAVPAKLIIKMKKIKGVKGVTLY
jgi:hypothetical protein